MKDQELSVNLEKEGVSMQPPNIANFLSPRLLQAIDQLSVREKGTADLQHSPEGAPSPPLGLSHQDALGGFAEDAYYYFDALAAEVATAATQAIDYWSPSLGPLERESAASGIAKAAAIPLAAGAADAALAATGEPADAGESGAPHDTAEETTAEEDASGWEWWW